LEGERWAVMLGFLQQEAACDELPGAIKNLKKLKK
jgi:hypothetical protein